MYRTVTIALSFIFYCDVTIAQTCEARQSKLAKAAVDNLRFVKSLPPKKGVAVTDPAAATIINYGRCASPFLVQALDNGLPSKVVQFYQYKIGQVALQLLIEIHQPKNYPCPEKQCAVKFVHGDFRDEVLFFNALGNRKKMKASWLEYIHRPA
jgi:hypothetical protein